MRLIDADALMKTICGKECGQHFEECQLEDDNEDTRCVFRDYVKSASTVETNPESGNPDSEKWCENCDHIEMCKWYPTCGCEFRQIGGKSLRSDLKKQTNGDRIRQMTDEELCYFMAESICDQADVCISDMPCRECRLAWLKQEAKTDD